MPKAQNPDLKAGNSVPTRNAVPTASARFAALRMLGRREYSEAQIRQRLARRGHASDEIDEAIARLKSDGAIDDARVAKAMARTATAVKGRGKRRVVQQLARAGISREVVRSAVEETFDSLDADQLIEAALAKRLRNGRSIADQKEFLRLYRYLVTQGFDSDQAFAALSKRRRGNEPGQEP